MSDYDARRRLKGKKHDAAATREPVKIIFYGCTNIDCRYCWTTPADNKCTVCRRCGAPGKQA